MKFCKSNDLETYFYLHAFITPVLQLTMPILFFSLEISQLNNI